MNHYRLRVGLIAAVALLAQTALAGPISAQDATPAAGATVEQIAVVTPASRTNQGWDQQAADGVEAVAKEAGIEAVVAENAGYDDITPVLKDLAAGGAGLIICHASGYQTVCPEFAAESGCRSRSSRTRTPSCRASFPISRPRRRKSPTWPVSWPANDHDGDGRCGRLRRAADLELHDGRIRRGSQGGQRTPSCSTA